MQATENKLGSQIMANIVAAVLVLGSMGASAAPMSDSVKGGAKGCPVCEQSVKNAATLAKLKYADKEDRFKGEDTANKSVTILDNFSKIKKSDKQRAKAFADIVALVREASPYDGEGQLAISLSQILKKNPELKPAYEQSLKSMSKAKGIESCKTQLFQANVGQNLCMNTDPTKDQDAPGAKADPKTDKCATDFSFNFDSCLK
jgi:hypothetical protein